MKTTNMIAGIMAAFYVVAFTAAPAQAEDKGYANAAASAYKAALRDAKKRAKPGMGAGTRG